MWCHLKENGVVIYKQVPISILVLDLKLEKTSRGRNRSYILTYIYFPDLGKMTFL